MTYLYANKFRDRFKYVSNKQLLALTAFAGTQTHGLPRFAYVDSPFVNNSISQLKNKCVLMYEL